MAVIQISKIQVRRGYQENLPQLGSGEFGWSIDQRRLYIGNGTLTEGAPELGNTEILTQNTDIVNVVKSYVFKGDESGYTSITGATISAFVQRTLQHKIDEQVSLRDFIMQSDIDSGDYTAALQRAIDQIWAVNNFGTVGVRRELHIPAGTYLITSPITIPPYASIRGDSAQGTIIQQQSAGSEVFILRDSKQQTRTGLGVTGGVLPFQIHIRDLTVQNLTDYDAFVVDSATDVSFDRIIFKGSRTSPATATSFGAVRLQDNAGTTSHISFNKCLFTSSTYGVVATGDVQNVVIDDCRFSGLYQAVKLQADGLSPQSIKVVNSLFDSVSAQAIYSGDNSSVVSAFNYFKTVATSDGASVTTGTPHYAIMSWNTANNFSMGDIFDRSASDIAIKPLIEVLSTTAPSKSAFSTAGSLQASPGFTNTLIDNTTSGNTTVVLNSGVTNIIDYVITRVGTVRMGTIQVSSLSGTALFSDDYTENTGTGVTLGFTGYGTQVVLTYTTTSTGNNATFKYNIRQFV